MPEGAVVKCRVESADVGKNLKQLLEELYKIKTPKEFFDLLIKFGFNFDERYKAKLENFITEDDSFYVDVASGKINIAAFALLETDNQVANLMEFLHIIGGDKITAERGEATEDCEVYKADPFPFFKYKIKDDKIYVNNKEFRALT